MTSSQTSRSTTIASFALGPYATNCYVLSQQGETAETQKCWVIDVGYEPGELIRYIQERGLVPQAVVLTHAHCDHIAGLDEFRALFADVEVALHKDEAGFPENAELNLSAFSGEPQTVAPVDRLLEGDELLEMAGGSWQVSHTPGHSPGGITLHNAREGVALVGDTLFAGSIGRHDFPTSNYADLERSIREKLYTLPDETQVLPGHGPTTTIGREKVSNPFVRA